jgi:hypothetical protein
MAVHTRHVLWLQWNRDGAPSVGSRHTDLRLDGGKLQNMPGRLSDSRMLALIIRDFLESEPPYPLIASKTCAGSLS